MNSFRVFALLSLCLCFAACESNTEPVNEASLPARTSSASSSSDETNPAANGMSSKMQKMKFPAPQDIQFKDVVESNVTLPNGIDDLVFTNKDGTQVEIADYLGKRNIVLVFTEGFNGMLCHFCKTQTSRLVANYEAFKKRDCEVIVVYPGPSDHLDEFVEAALTTEKTQVEKVPFPIVLDKDFAATNFFEIQSMHAHPSTYLIDKSGSIKFAYVGSDMTADRPSVKAILGKLDQMSQ